MSDFIISIVMYAWPLWASNLLLNLYGILKLRSVTLQTYDRPLDGAKNFFDGNRILGSSTTWGGLLVILVPTLLCTYLIPSDPFIFLKFLSGFLGHCIASFIKRRCGIKEGRYIPFLAHGDYIIVFGIFSFFVTQATFMVWLASYFVTILFTPLVTLTFYRLGFRKDPL